MDCSLPGSSVHGIFQARVVEWGAIGLLVEIKLDSANKRILPDAGSRSGSTTYYYPDVLDSVTDSEVICQKLEDTLQVMMKK